MPGMIRVIITGADGFVGSYTARCFAEHGVSVLAVDRLAEPRRLVLSKRLSYLQADITDLESLRAVLPQLEFDTFIHLAWMGSAGSERTDYRLQMLNALCAVDCLKFAKQIGCKRFVCAGSIMEREVEAVVHSQGSKPGAAYIYGMGKHIAHSLCKAVAAEIGVDLIWPMITNAYGEGEYSPRFINTTIRKILRREPLQFTSGTQNYDFVHVEDVARALYLISEHGKPFYEYLIGSGNARPLRQFVLELQRTLAPEAEPLFGDLPYTGINMPLSAFDTSVTEKDCFFRAEIPFAAGVRRTMDWLKTVEGEQA